MGPGLFDALQKIAATFALFVGGAWVPMNYRRNRTQIPRLQIDDHPFDRLAPRRMRHLGVDVRPKAVFVALHALPDFADRLSLNERRTHGFHCFEAVLLR
jgi:hypothetical protein